MKRIFLMPVLMLIAIGAGAQFNYGVHAGGSFANTNNEVTDPTSAIKQTFNSNSKFGFTIGAVTEIPIHQRFSLRPELNFVQKNFSINYLLLDWGLAGKLDFLTNHIEVPVNIIYSYPLAIGNIFVGAGPSISMGLNGKLESDGGHIDIKFDGKSNDDINDPDLHFNRFDLGFGFIAGQVFSNGLFGSIGYNFGLSNLSPDPDYETTKSKMFTLKVGYMFNNKSKSAKKNSSGI